MPSNRWNRFIYSCWAPVYDVLVRVRPIARSRRIAFRLAALPERRRLLLAGIGTGEDLPLLPPKSFVVGIDLSRAMLRRAAAKSAPVVENTCFLQADAQALPLTDGAFDVAVLTLILSVVPDAVRCLEEVVRVLEPGGRVIVMDKFLRAGAPVSLSRRILNMITRPFGTDINRSFEDMAHGMALEVVHDEAVAFGGAYRVIILRKPDGN